MPCPIMVPHTLAVISRNSLRNSLCEVTPQHPMDWLNTVQSFKAFLKKSAGDATTDPVFVSVLFHSFHNGCMSSSTVDRTLTADTSGSDVLVLVLPSDLMQSSELMHANKLAMIN